MDIVQRLRDTIVNETPARYPDVVEAAAVEIERLRAELSDLRDEIKEMLRVSGLDVLANRIVGLHARLNKQKVGSQS